MTSPVTMVAVTDSDAERASEVVSLLGDRRIVRQVGPDPNDLLAHPSTVAIVSIDRLSSLRAVRADLPVVVIFSDPAELSAIPDGWTDALVRWPASIVELEHRIRRAREIARMRNGRLDTLAAGNRQMEFLSATALRLLETDPDAIDEEIERGMRSAVGDDGTAFAFLERDAGDVVVRLAHEFELGDARLPGDFLDRCESRELRALDGEDVRTLTAALTASKPGASFHGMTVGASDGRRYGVVVAFAEPPGEQKIAQVQAFVRQAIVAFGRRRALMKERAVEHRLMQTQKVEALGKLAGGIAHEFNNLMMAIIAYAEFVREDLPPDDSKRDDISQLLTAANRAAELTRQLLVFAQRQPMNERLVDIEELLEGSRRLLVTTMGEDIDVHYVHEDDSAVIHADPAEVERVVLDMAVNAKEAMPAGGTFRICSRVASFEDGAPGPGRWVEIRLEDDGEGMNEETLHRAFDPFFTTKDVGQGTGLGLSTAFGTITRLGGTIEAESALGAGSTFTIWLPVADGTPDTVEAVAPVGEFDGQLILVVEDELVVREAVVRALRAQGCRVVEARDGAEAIECFESHRDEIDLVFCDVGLPKMSGVHVVRQIVGQRPDVRIVFTTGYSAIARDELDALSSAVLSKPYDLPSMFAALRESLATE